MRPFKYYERKKKTTEEEIEVRTNWGTKFKL